MSRLFACLVLVATIFIPLVTNGAQTAPVFPRGEWVAFQTVGYQLVGGASPSVVCAADGTLRLRAYAKTTDNAIEGDLVFRADLATRMAHEVPASRSPVVVRGGAAGLDLERCGIDDYVHVVIREQDDAFLVRVGD